MRIVVDSELILESLEYSHTRAIYEVANANRHHLLPWLPWVAQMEDVSFITKYIEGSLARQAEGKEFGFVILLNNELVGRVGVYHINNKKRMGEIGYWVAEAAKGKKIAARSCKALIDYCFDELQLDRIEIKCGLENIKSKSIPLQLGFKKEDDTSQTEWLSDRIISLEIFSLQKSASRK